MAKLPRLTGREMVAFLVGRGLRIIRVRGSHHFLESDQHRTCVPVHGNRNLKLGTLRSILRDIDMSPSEFETELHRQRLIRYERRVGFCLATDFIIAGARIGAIHFAIVFTALEDRFLLAELEVYAEFAKKVRYRPLPGIW